MSKKILNLKNFLKQNIQEFWVTIKRPNMRILDIGGEEFQYRGSENILNKLTEETFPNSKKDTPIKVQKEYRRVNRLD